MVRFSTHLLDRALAKERLRREERRRERLTSAFQTLDKLSRQITFKEVYIFGSLTKTNQYFEKSDIDIAFVELKDEDFFRAMAFLSHELRTEVDVIQLEKHPLREMILKEGIRWKKEV